MWLGKQQMKHIFFINQSKMMDECMMITTNVSGKLCNVKLTLQGRWLVW